jgi:catechol 2,3-dioxygenase-like lactoylglutathione lyase family enzyme
MRLRAKLAAGLLASTMVVFGNALAAEAPPAATTRFDHLALHVADLEKSAAFYQRMFGLKELPASVSGLRWLSLGGTLALHLIPGRTGTVVDDRSVHLALTVTDFDGVLARLRADNVPFGDFAGNPGAINRTRADRVRQIYLRDPDGYWIEVNDVAMPTT